MAQKENDFKKRLLKTFRIEAEDHLKAISSGLVALEGATAGGEGEIIETVFRAAHSLKGAARAVALSGIEKICQSLEGVFAAWKTAGVEKDKAVFDAIHSALGVVRELAAASEGGHDEGRVMEAVIRLSKIEAGPGGAPGAQAPPETEPSGPPETNPGAGTRARAQSASTSDTVRISAEKLAAILLDTEEMLTEKFKITETHENIRDISSTVGALREECSRLYSQAGAASGRTHGARLKEFMEHALARIKGIEAKVSSLERNTLQHGKTFEKMVFGLLDNMKQIMMLPFSTLLESFPMLVRDIARSEGKDVELVIEGEGVEMDRRVIEEIKDALIHLVRNCVGHGVEKPDERKRKGKPGKGTILISVTHMEGGKARILVSDDGGGIDAGKVKEAAVKCGAVTEGEAEGMTGSEAASLIFQSGVSTSPIVTDISGRGLGLAIVREKAEKLGGRVTVETQRDKGTAFSVVIPLTMATFRGILVRASGHLFLIPSTAVERTLRVKDEEIKTVENRETIRINGTPASYVRLASVLGLPAEAEDRGRDFAQAVAVSSEGRRMALGVDEVIGEQDVLVKRLGRQLQRVRNVSGAAVLGTGKPVPILNVSDLIASAIKAGGAKAAKAGPAKKTEKNTILVVEDSITSRTLIKSILENAGYAVKTAVDGADAMATLKEGEFDLVVSDIEMPRMDGFELTAKVRGDKRLSGLPVVLVTALEAREDRERGIEAGANAYIVKSSFNQNNLLEVIKRLL
ncbi:MAG: hybrid sensor histidine kinase/response regulator [Deltaproteobacteria bacterium]|nr:hybrid sensor histidine kinase/response regulator [Deltaproteobacteria bacterium]